jgi:hypothetical protein
VQGNGRCARTASPQGPGRAINGTDCDR